MKEYNPIAIFCPQCLRRVGTYDGRSTTNYIFGCRRCKKRILYNIDKEKVEVKPLPQRNCSSGMTFY